MILKCFGYFFFNFACYGSSVKQFYLVWLSSRFVCYGLWCKKKEYNFTVHYSLVITWEIVWFYYDENKTGG